MSEWKEYKLGEIINDVAMGPFGSNIKVDNFISSGIPVIRGSNLNQGGFDDRYFVFVSEEKAKTLKRSLAYPGDLVFTHRGTLGQVGIIEKTKYPYYLVSQSQMRLTVNKVFLCPRYLYYWFKSKTGQYELLKNSAQVGVPSIASPTKSMKEIDISIPDLPTQTAIAEILSSLDDKIELNNKINQELENLAQTLFKRWFVDFDFPNENGEPYKSSGGEMVDSELGQIPKGWEVFKIGEVLDLVSGYPFKGESFSKDGNYGIVTIKNVQDGLFVEQIDNYIDKLPNKFPANIRLTVGDILMSLTGNVGRVCYVTSDDCLLNQRVVKFNSVQENANAFWYYYFRQNVIKDLLISISKGTAQLNLSPVETKLLKCKLPRIIAPNILSAFDVIFRKQIECSMANKNLCNLRNTLLPKLISGELEVNQTLN